VQLKQSQPEERSRAEIAGKIHIKVDSACSIWANIRPAFSYTSERDEWIQPSNRKLLKIMPLRYHIMTMLGNFLPNVLHPEEM
jgi:hypothetical protein